HLQPPITLYSRTAVPANREADQGGSPLAAPKPGAWLRVRRIRIQRRRNGPAGGAPGRSRGGPPRQGVGGNGRTTAVPCPPSWSRPAAGTTGLFYRFASLILRLPVPIRVLVRWGPGPVPGRLAHAVSNT